MHYATTSRCRTFTARVCVVEWWRDVEAADADVYCRLLSRLPEGTEVFGGKHTRDSGLWKYCAVVRLPLYRPTSECEEYGSEVFRFYLNAEVLRTDSVNIVMVPTVEEDERSFLLRMQSYCVDNGITLPGFYC